MKKFIVSFIVLSMIFMSAIAGSAAEKIVANQIDTGEIATVGSMNAVAGSVAAKADKTYVDNNFSTTGAVVLKADKSYVDSQDGSLAANLGTHESLINTKADKTYVDGSDAVLLAGLTAKLSLTGGTMSGNILFSTSDTGIRPNGSDKYITVADSVAYSKLQIYGTYGSGPETGRVTIQSYSGGPDANSGQIKFVGFNGSTATTKGFFNKYGGLNLGTGDIDSATNTYKLYTLGAMKAAGVITGEDMEVTNDGGGIKTSAYTNLIQVSGAAGSMYMRLFGQTYATAALRGNINMRRYTGGADAASGRFIFENYNGSAVITDAFFNKVGHLNIDTLDVDSAGSTYSVYVGGATKLANGLNLSNISSGTGSSLGIDGSGNVVTVAGGGSSTTGTNSVSITDGVAQLVNDTLAPGANYDYGTDYAGTKGFQSLPAYNVLMGENVNFASNPVPFSLVQRNGFMRAYPTSRASVISNGSYPQYAIASSSTLSMRTTGMDMELIPLAKEQAMGFYVDTSNALQMIYTGSTNGNNISWGGSAIAVTGATSVDQHRAILVSEHKILSVFRSTATSKLSAVLITWTGYPSSFGSGNFTFSSVVTLSDTHLPATTARSFAIALSEQNKVVVTYIDAASKLNYGWFDISGNTVTPTYYTYLTDTFSATPTYLSLTTRTNGKFFVSFVESNNISGFALETANNGALYISGSKYTISTGLSSLTALDSSAMTPDKVIFTYLSGTTPYISTAIKVNGTWNTSPSISIRMSGSGFAFGKLLQINEKRAVFIGQNSSSFQLHLIYINAEGNHATHIQGAEETAIAGGFGSTAGLLSAAILGYRDSIFVFAKNTSGSIFTSGVRNLAFSQMVRISTSGRMDQPGTAGVLSMDKDRQFIWYLNNSGYVMANMVRLVDAMPVEISDPYTISTTTNFQWIRVFKKSPGVVFMIAGNGNNIYSFVITIDGRVLHLKASTTITSTAHSYVDMTVDSGGMIWIGFITTGGAIQLWTYTLSDDLVLSSITGYISNNNIASAAGLSLVRAELGQAITMAYSQYSNNYLTISYAKMVNNGVSVYGGPTSIDSATTYYPNLGYCGNNRYLVAYSKSGGTYMNSIYIDPQTYTIYSDSAKTFINNAAQDARVLILDKYRAIIATFAASGYLNKLYMVNHINGNAPVATFISNGGSYSTAHNYDVIDGNTVIAGGIDSVMGYPYVNTVKIYQDELQNKFAGVPDIGTTIYFAGHKYQGQQVRFKTFGNFGYDFHDNDRVNAGSEGTPIFVNRDGNISYDETDSVAKMGNLTNNGYSFNINKE